MRRLMVAWVVALVAGVVVSLALGASGTAPGKWVVRDLGARWNTYTQDSSFLETPYMTINDRGQILGEGQTTAGRRYTFLWQNGTTIQLPFVAGEPMPYRPGDGKFVGAPSLNDRGQVAGIVRRAGAAAAAVLWEDGKIRRVGRANGALINDGGQVVAWSSDGHWFLWENGNVRVRGRMDASVNWRIWSEQGAIVAINDHGQIAGRALLGAPDHSWLWQKGTTIDLGTPPTNPGDPPGRFVTDLNERGQVVGFDIPDEPFLWQNGTLRRLDGGSSDWHPGDEIAINDRGQVLASYGGEWSLWEAGRFRVEDAEGDYVAINNRGQVVGFGGRPPGDEALVWKDAFLWVNGKWTGLPLLPGDVGGGAVALNERNQIVGVSCAREFDEPLVEGTWLCRAVLWTLQPAK